MGGTLRHTMHSTSFFLFLLFWKTPRSILIHTRSFLATVFMHLQGDWWIELFLIRLFQLPTEASMSRNTREDVYCTVWLLYLCKQVETAQLADNTVHLREPLPLSTGLEDTQTVSYVIKQATIDIHVIKNIIKCITNEQTVGSQSVRALSH